MTRRRGLPARLLAAQLFVIGVGALTLAVVAFAVGPPLFRHHLHEALRTVSPQVNRHLEDAYATAAGIAVGVGVGVSVMAAAVVSLLLTRRISNPIQVLDAAAARLAAGDYAIRMPPTGLGPELDTLTGAFNTMAAALEGTEQTRRRLLADVTHELRTPLATISAYLEGLADGVRQPTQQTWDIMAGQATRLRRLVDDMALVSRAEEHQLDLSHVRTAPGDLVTTAAHAARPGYDARDVELVTRLAGSLPELTADPSRLGQVLDGLLSNALRHTPPGGRVTIAAEPAGQAVRIIVTDTGAGIAAEHLPHVFERFYRGDAARDREHGGSGIGLTIAKAIVTAHTGTLIAASNGPGTGATFVITLPAAVAGG